MKNTELRIGNIVGRKAYLFNGVIEETTNPCKIVAIDENRVMCLIVGATYIVETEMLIGIPITPEWLKTFKKEEYKPHRTYFNSEIGFPPYEFKGGILVPSDSYYHGFMPCIHYVHQLQNVYFALTGKEL